MSDGIQFELRRRQRVKQDFWSVFYDTDTGKILSIEPGQSLASNSLSISYARVQKILSGQANQNDFKIEFNEKLGALDLVDIKRPAEYKRKQKQNWYHWLNQTEYSLEGLTDLKTTLFEENGFLRVECSREWGQRTKENPAHVNTFDLYLTDIEDPHLMFGHAVVDVQQLIERGYWEQRTWSFMEHDLVQKILYQNQRTRVNLPPVAESVSFKRSKNYFPFAGIIDDQTVISHPGAGRHITVFVKDRSVWAQSHYEPGSIVDDILGNMRAGLIQGDEPDGFVGWVELPALMLRQTRPFELIADWKDPHPPNLLYKANNIDIGVLQ